MGTTDIKVGLVQFRIEHGNPADNIARMTRHIESAKAKGARLVVFPEDAVTGPLTAQQEHVASASAFLATFQQLARQHDVDLVPGSWVVAEGAALYNTTHYIRRDGTVAGSYRKIALWPTERQLTPGAAVSVFQTELGVVGLSICWDLSSDGLFTQMQALGAQWVIVPAYWSFTRPSAEVDAVRQTETAVIDTVCLKRAVDHNIALIFCNAAGTLKAEGLDGVLCGRSQMTHPQHGVIARSTTNDETLLMARLELAA